MKLLIAIVRSEFEGDVNFALNEKGFTVTRISTTGGFWRRGNTTLLVGIENGEIDEALATIDEHAGPEVDSERAPKAHPPHRATIFVLDVDAFAQY
ncbi:MAG: cyclic-di-AMP receptor [Chloroflexota bacterium]|nr:cyclic-di-AMP receptor [Chloroflexota bacterium]